MFYVYILQSEIKNRLYIGRTADLRRRYKEHNAGQSASTKSHTPWRLIFYEAYFDRQDAVRRERYLKTTQGHQAIRRMLQSYLDKCDMMYFNDQGSTT